MSFAEFSNAGYEYFNKSNFILFSTDSSHGYLLDYIAKDLSRLPELLEQYVSKRMDTTTFEINREQHNTDEITEIEQLLRSVHPYYEHEYKAVILKAIGEYFNGLLMYSVALHHVPSEQITQDWHKERFVYLTQEVLGEHGSYPKGLGPKSFFTEYERWEKDEYLVSSDTPEEDFLLNVPSQRPAAFISEITTQRMIANMLYFILDIAAPNIDHLSVPQRAWLYGNIFRSAHSQSLLKVIEQLSFFPQPRFYSGDRTQEVEYAGKLHDTFAPLYALSNINVAHDGIAESMRGHFKAAIEYAEQVSSTQIYREYEIDSLRQLLYLEVLNMIQEGTMIRKCKNCGKYFVVRSRNSVYCERINDSGHTCYTVSSRQTFQNRMDNEEGLKIYTRAYNTHFVRFKKGKMTRAELDEWCAEAKAKLTQVRAGELDLPTFQAWLKK